MSLTPEKMMDMLEEIGGYEVALEADPTQPHLGTKYLQKVLSECRNYMNRVQYYLSQVKMHERQLRTQLKIAESDFDLKIAEKLADDVLVRKQPSIEDRKALAMTMLRDEHTLIANLRMQLTDSEETGKLIKAKYDHLKGTVSDIKMQRSLVRDDAMIRMEGGSGFDRPVINQDRSVPNGMRAPVTRDDLNPTDLLDGAKRPDYMPEPVDAAHAQMIADFFSTRNPVSHISAFEQESASPDLSKTDAYGDLFKI